MMKVVSWLRNMELHPSDRRHLGLKRYPLYTWRPKLSRSRSTGVDSERSSPISTGVGADRSQIFRAKQEQEIELRTNKLQPLSVFQKLYRSVSGEESIKFSKSGVTPEAEVKISEPGAE